MIKHYLLSKSLDCTEKTIQQYCIRIRKLGLLLNNHFGLSLNWNIKIPYKSEDKIRDIWFDRKDYDDIMKIKSESKAQSYIALDLAGRFALRVSESTALRVKDFNLENKTLHIHRSKGGRSRDIPIFDEDLIICRTYIKGLSPESKIVSVYEDAVNKYLHRACVQFGFKEYLDAKTGVHAIRKMRAQEIYDNCRYQGMDKKKAAAYVNWYLGHGYNRIDITNTYIFNQW